MRRPRSTPNGRVRGATALLAGLLLVLTACTGGGDTPQPPATPSPATRVLSAAEADPAILPERPGKDLRPVRLADGLTPPTNRWFSGLVFGDQIQPVFPLPLTFGVEENTFGFGLPPVHSTGKTIIGGYTPTIQVTLADVTDWRVTAYDDMSVTLTALAGSEPAGHVVIARGSPFIGLTAEQDLTLSTNIPFTGDERVRTVTAGEGEYAVTGGTLTDTGVTLAAGEHTTFFAVPEDGDAATLAELAADPLDGTSVAYAVDDEVATTLTWRTRGGGPTALAALPHQRTGAEGCDLGTYRSAYGTMALCRGTELTWTAPLRAARSGLDLDGLDQTARTEIAEAVKRDVHGAEPYPADTYFGGKALYRDATLLGIARQVGADTEAEILRERATTELRRWADPNGCDDRATFCFTYDPTNRGVVGQEASFGADEFNDHHFHYGYFLYAAGILAADDPALQQDIAPVMNLLAADIAMAPATEHFPQWRNFDAYGGHSWASGTAPFADGNNQESVSEAINAWAGLTLWARASGNSALEAQGQWLHAVEAQASRAYWTDFDRNDPAYAGYDHTITPLNFGGKRDYATWFSPEPAAALAILVIPASPSSDHLAGDPERIRENVAEATGTRGFQQQYGDYLLMYSALAGEEDRQQALTEARAMGPDDVDDGNTYAYLLAWLHAAGQSG
ncbi:glycosyl hydrolase [Granulicoccus sp. GXG6511]|uniref:glycosyl hydrolase n=1 Tax=Granulicoccus sp. GXG6511 TaxID=3381351 RepID=UPI003D7E74C1